MYIWKDIVDKLYLENDFIQGNKTDYKNTLINYGNCFENVDFFDEYTERLDNSTASTARTHTQTGIAMYKLVSVEKFRYSYQLVKNDFLSISNFGDIKMLLDHYDRIKGEVFFQVYDKHKTAGELNSFFNIRLRNVVESKLRKNNTLLKNIKYVLYNTNKYIQAQDGSIELFIDDINNSTTEQIQATLDKYYKVHDGRPVNGFRRKILIDLLNGEKITVDKVNKQVAYLKSTGAHNWKPFSLLAGLYYNLFELKKTELELDKQIQELFNNCELSSEYKFHKLFTQQGAQNYGSGHFGVCFLKQKFKANKTNQLVFEITNNVSVKFYDAILNESMNETIIDIESPTLEIDIINGFRNAAKEFYDNDEVLDNDIDEFVEFSEIENGIYNDTVYDINEYDNNYQQLIIDGAPGTSKSYSLNKEITDNNIRHERVTFHQDYEYHNFVGSILPVVNDKMVSYKFIKGPFTKLLNDAFANPESKHYLVIEELTRGNAPAIFGDIFQLLDRDSDGWSRYPISNDSIFTSLDAEVQAFLNSNINFKGKVVLPPNFSIICTINSSDQNVYPLDTAFKRRFNYEIKSTEASNDFNNFDIYFGNEEDKLSIDWIKFQSKLNDYILNNLKLNEDKQVGPYFIKESDTSASIQTKLAMYMWNDLQKVHTMNGNKIFNDKVKTLYKVDELFRTGSKEEIKAILTEEFIDKMKLV